MFVIAPEKSMDINLADVKNYLKKKGFSLRVEAELGLTFGRGEVKVSVLKSGITILEGFKEKDEALKLFNELTGSC